MLPNHLNRLPPVTLLHGDNDHAIGQSLEKITSFLGDAGMADLNISRMDGMQSGLDEIRNNLFTIPFLAERRMLILSHPLAKINDAGSRENFIHLLNDLPETAALVIVLEDVFERKDWKLLTKNHWLRAWIKTADARVLYLPYQLPAGDQMTGWIISYARSLNGQFEPRAAAELASCTGNDTRLAATEIEKLLTYVNYKRPVAVDDVILLTAATGAGNIFDLIDAIAQQNSRKALQLLHRQLDQQEPGALFFMIVRQFRLLIQAREIMDEGGMADRVEQEMKVHPFVAKKTVDQARRFQLPRLLEIYHQLFGIDEAVKTGQTTMDLALDVFIASLE